MKKSIMIIIAILSLGTVVLTGCSDSNVATSNSTVNTNETSIVNINNTNHLEEGKSESLADTDETSEISYLESSVIDDKNSESESESSTMAEKNSSTVVFESSIIKESSVTEIESDSYDDNIVNPDTMLTEWEENNLSDEQASKIIELRQRQEGNFLYQKALIKGEIDEETPKVTLEAVRELIDTARQDEQLWSDKYNLYEYFHKGLVNLQEQPDVIKGLGSSSMVKEYWLNSNIEEEVREKITIIDVEPCNIIYYRYDDDGNLIYTEVLYTEEYYVGTFKNYHPDYILPSFLETSNE